MNSGQLGSATEIQTALKLIGFIDPFPALFPSYAVRRFKAHPGAIAAAEIGFKLLSEFNPSRNVAGIGYAGDFVGLKVVEDPKIKGKMTIDMGKGFVDRLTPKTLQLRVGELVKAADMTMFRKSGVVPSK